MSDINTSCSTLEQILNEGNVLLDGQVSLYIPILYDHVLLYVPVYIT